MLVVVDDEDQAFGRRNLLVCFFDAPSLHPKAPTVKGVHIPPGAETSDLLSLEDRLESMVRILLVDDDDLFREFLAEIVRGEGFEPVAANSGEAALLTLRAMAKSGKSADYPDVIMVDFNMKRINGFEFLRAVRKMEPFSRMPIMMVSGTTKDIKGAVEMEGVKFLQKGSPVREIVRQIQEFIPAGKAQAAKEAKAAAAEAQATAPSPPMRVEKVATFGSDVELPPIAPNGGERPDDQLQHLMVLSRTIVDQIQPQVVIAKPNEGVEDASKNINLVDGILDEAILHHASDIHLDPQQNGMRLR